MSTLLENTAEPKTKLRTISGFHLHLAYAYSVVLLVTIIACRLASIQVRGIASLALGFASACVVVFTVAVFWHERGRPDFRGAILSVPWVLLLAATMPWLVLAAARLNLPLKDIYLVRADEMFGISVPGIMSWASQHWLGRVINRAYPLLSPLLVVSVALPALAGKIKHAQQFVLNNLVAFIIGLPLFAFVPAIGPWYGYGFSPTPGQAECQSAILLFRAPGHVISHLGAIICFPSFHVIWAIFSGAALWGFRIVRIPVALCCGMIIVSTVSTGWHYFTDVLGGIVVGVLSLRVTSRYMNAASPAVEMNVIR